MYNFMTVISHGAQHLLALVAGAERSIHAIEAKDPLVGTAVQIGVAEAERLGVPVPAIEQLGAAVLTAAQAVAAGAVVPPAATVADPAPAPAGGA